MGMAEDFRHKAEFLWAEIEKFYAGILRGDSKEAAVQMHRVVREVQPVLRGLETQWQTLTPDQRLWCRRLISDLTMATQELEMLKQCSLSTDSEEERPDCPQVTSHTVESNPHRILLD
jgi:hypothetical protein